MANVKSAAAAAAKTTGKPVHIPAAMSAAWVSAFGDVTCPAYVVGMAGVVSRAFRSVPVGDRAAATFDTWLAAIRTADKRDAPVGPAHRFTNGSGRDIARTQNVLYVACAMSGVRAADVSNAFGMALWAHMLNGTNTAQFATRAYWRSTMADFVNGRHNDAYGLPLESAARAVRLWRDAKPGDVVDAPPAAPPVVDAPPAADEPAAS
jgi:hypothetical protein